MSTSDALTPVPSRRRQGIKNGESAVPGGSAAEKLTAQVELLVAAGPPRQDLDAKKLAEHIRQIVEAAPPLSVTQKQRLAALLWSDR